MRYPLVLEFVAPPGKHYTHLMAEGFFDFRARVTRRATPARPAQAPAPASPGASAAPDRPLTVTELTNRIGSALNQSFPGRLSVQGELSGYRGAHSSGHHYFTLKDKQNCLSCVLFQSNAARLRFELHEGLVVVATGRIQVRGQQGRYQLLIENLAPLGQGALELAFRQLKEKLEREGLFAPERKRPVPRFPQRILLVTSRDGAALQDMLKVLRRFPWLKLMLFHVSVQGDYAAGEIAAALRLIARTFGPGARPARPIAMPDVILLGRGGGSAEDLWCFNEEAVARAVAASPIPVVTGIGHEVDTSIADLVADHHAHTPTEAAQFITTHWRAAADSVHRAVQRAQRGVGRLLASAIERLRHVERHEIFRQPLRRLEQLAARVNHDERRLAMAMAGQVRGLRNRMAGLTTRLDAQHPSLQLSRQHAKLRTFEQRMTTAASRLLRDRRTQLDRLGHRLLERHPRHRVGLTTHRITALHTRLTRAGVDLVRRRTDRLEALAHQLQIVGPEQVLSRGFTLTLRKRDREIMRSAADIHPGEIYITRFADGEVEWVAGDGQLRLFS